MTRTPGTAPTFTSAAIPQLTLPGQTHTAQGPHDLSGMYFAHHAFRRDLRRFVSAVQQTPCDDAATWRRLAARWHRFTEVLHHHHALEDALIWPPMLASAEAEGREQDRTTLLAMEAEHETVDPALERCTRAFGDMVSHPCDDHQNALAVRVTAVRELLSTHLEHEETGALPLVQRTLSKGQWEAIDKAADRGYPARMMPFLLGWASDSLPPEGRAHLEGSAGVLLRWLLRIAVVPYARRERRTFHYASLD